MLNLKTRPIQSVSVDTVLEQMGGRHRLQRMIGAHNFAIHSDTLLSFHFLNDAQRWICKIEYNAAKGLYNMVFQRICGLEVRFVEMLHDLRSTQLSVSFSLFTGVCL